MKNFLTEELNLSPASVHLAWRQSDYSLVALPMTLWQYGLISLGEMDRVFSCLDALAWDLGV